jgi:Helix-turn-helix domain
MEHRGMTQQGLHSRTNARLRCIIHQQRRRLRHVLIETLVAWIATSQQACRRECRATVTKIAQRGKKPPMGDKMRSWEKGIFTKLMIYARQPTDAERLELQRMTRQAVGRVSQRAQMLLLSIQHRTVPELAALFAMRRATGRFWIRRFNAHGPAGVSDARRRGRPRRAARRSWRGW